MRNISISSTSTPRPAPPSPCGPCAPPTAYRCTSPTPSPCTTSISVPWAAASWPPTEEATTDLPWSCGSTTCKRARMSGRDRSPRTAASWIRRPFPSCWPSSARTQRRSPFWRVHLWVSWRRRWAEGRWSRPPLWRPRRRTQRSRSWTLGPARRRRNCRSMPAPSISSCRARCCATGRSITWPFKWRPTRIRRRSARTSPARG